MRAAVLVLASFTLACASTRPQPTLAQLADEYWQHALEQNINARADLGLPIEKLPDVSFARAEKEAVYARVFLARVERIDETALSDEEKITRAMLVYHQREAIDAVEHFWLQSPVTPYASPINAVNAALATLPLGSEAEIEHYARLMEQYGAFIDSIASIVREQQRRGILLPKADEGC